MRRLYLKICCYLGGVFIVVLALLPIIRLMQQAYGDGRASYDDEVYFRYHIILSTIILLGSIVGAVILIWIGHRLKVKVK